MLFNPKREASEPDSLARCCARAFSKQTLKNGEYVKPDVKRAREALNAYSNSKAPETLEAAKTAVAECIMNNRSGFVEVSKALNREPKPEPEQPARKKKLGL